MKPVLTAFIAILAVVALVAPASAQRDAGAKIRGDAYSIHSSSMYTQHARDHAAVLYDYGRTRQSIPPEVSAEHVQGVRTNVAAAQKELAKLKQDKAADKELMKHIAALEASYAKCEEMCKMCEKESGNDKPDMEMMCECCATMSQELDAAKAEHDKLTKMLNAPKMVAPKRKESK